MYIFILYGRPTSWQELLKQTYNTRLVVVWISLFFSLTHNWRFTSWLSAWSSTLLLWNHSKCNSIFLDIFLQPRFNNQLMFQVFSLALFAHCNRIDIVPVPGQEIFNYFCRRLRQELLCYADLETLPQRGVLSHLFAGHHLLITV